MLEVHAGVREEATLGIVDCRSPLHHLSVGLAIQVHTIPDRRSIVTDTTDNGQDPRSITVKGNRFDASQVDRPKSLPY